MNTFFNLINTQLRYHCDDCVNREVGNRRREKEGTDICLNFRLGVVKLGKLRIDHGGIKASQVILEFRLLCP